MPNNVREMTDEQLLERAYFPRHDSPIAARNELYRRLSALRDEVERLRAKLAKQPWKWEEVAVMRELCEADQAALNDVHDDRELGSAWQRKEKARDAYRAMKGEKDAKR